MAIYHMNLQIIGRGSGRSAIGASAYRSGQKLRAVEKAAYRSGEELRDQNTKLVHDYTKRSDVVYNEIMLPKNARKDFADRETLWNAVEAKETYKNARLAREINVALPVEFDFEEQLAVLREYIQTNFIDEGLIADLAIHDKGDGNPHAHIMVTTRYATPDGLGNKNRDLDKREYLQKWRESWAYVNNRMFEGKELDIRIDHRTLKAQGIDREPTIHLGHEVWALEKKGIKTEKGDYNREIQRRNRERAGESDEGNTKKPYLLKEERMAKTPQDTASLEEQLKAEKALQITEKLQEQREDRREAEKIVKYMDSLTEDYITLEKELNTLKSECYADNHEIPKLHERAENIEEHPKNIEIQRAESARLQALHQNLRPWDLKQKKEIKQKIVQAELKIQREKDFIRRKYHIEYDDVQEELARIRKEIREKKHELPLKEERVIEIIVEQHAIALKYRKQKLLNELHPDREHIEDLLEHHRRQPKLIRDRLQYQQIRHKLSAVPDEIFQAITKDMQEEQVKVLTRNRELAKEIERERAIERERYRERERER